MRKLKATPTRRFHAPFRGRHGKPHARSESRRAGLREFREAARPPGGHCRPGDRPREAARRAPPRAERPHREAEEGAERREREDPRAHADRQGRRREGARRAARARRRGEGDGAGARAGRGGDRAAAPARAEPAARVGAGRQGRAGQPRRLDLGREAGDGLHAEAALGARRGARRPRVAAGREALRLALHDLQGRRRPARARHRRVLHRRPHEPRLHARSCRRTSSPPRR